MKVFLAMESWDYEGEQVLGVASNLEDAKLIVEGSLSFWEAEENVASGWLLPNDSSPAWILDIDTPSKHYYVSEMQVLE